MSSFACTICGDPAEHWLPVVHKPLCGVECQRIYWHSLASATRHFIVANPHRTDYTHIGNVLIEHASSSSSHKQAKIGSKFDETSRDVDLELADERQGYIDERTFTLTRRLDGRDATQLFTAIGVYDGHGDSIPLDVAQSDDDDDTKKPERNPIARALARGIGERFEPLLASIETFLRQVYEQVDDNEPMKFIDDLFKSPLDFQAAEAALTELFTFIDDNLLTSLPKSDVKQQVIQFPGRGFLSRSQELVLNALPNGGSTATVALVTRSPVTRKTLLISIWLGDTSVTEFSVVGQRRPLIVTNQFTLPVHNLAENVGEQQRIRRVGGERIGRDSNTFTASRVESPRIELRASRAFGDYVAKRDLSSAKAAASTTFTEGLVIAVPSLFVSQIDVDTNIVDAAGNEFESPINYIVTASNNVWTLLDRQLVARSIENRIEVSKNGIVGADEVVELIVDTYKDRVDELKDNDNEEDVPTDTNILVSVLRVISDAQIRREQEDEQLIRSPEQKKSRSEQSEE